MAAANFWGQLIKDLRDENDMSQRELARRASVNRHTLSNVEKGDWPVAVEFLEAVLGCLGYELEAISASGIVQKKATVGAIPLTKVD